VTVPLDYVPNEPIVFLTVRTAAKGGRRTYSHGNTRRRRSNGDAGTAAQLERTFETPLGFDLALSGRGVFPPVNVFAGRDEYLFRFEVAGIAPQDIRIETHDRTLEVSGKGEPKIPTAAATIA